MSSNETAAYEIMKTLDVDYVLVIFGGAIGYSGDDINKFLWMVRIAEGEHPKDIRVSLFNRFYFGNWIQNFSFIIRCYLHHYAVYWEAHFSPIIVESVNEKPAKKW